MQNIEWETDEYHNTESVSCGETDFRIHPYDLGNCAYQIQAKTRLPKTPWVTIGYARELETAKYLCACLYGE